ncbi:MAG: PAS domain S-box protein [Acidobacteria bacterium]|nr:PAS domain S-box protein [Acidobacteriota bacterium]
MKSSLEKVIRFKQTSNGNEPFINILSDLPDAVLLIGDRSEIFYANKQARKIFGLDHRKIEKITDIFPENSVFQSPDYRRAHWDRLQKTRVIDNFETQVINADGAIIEVDVSESPIFDKNGKICGLSAVIKDLTQRREREKRIERRNNQLFALIDVAEAITQLNDETTFLRNVLDAVLRVTSLQSGCIYLFNEEEEFLRLAIYQNLSDQTVRILENFELGEGIIGQAAVLNETLIVSNTATDRRLSRPVAAEQIGSMAAVPLVGRGGNLRGVLALFNGESRVFTEHENSMLTAIGKQVGVALERTKLLQEVNDSRQEWEETFDAMTDGVSIHAPSGKIRRANESLAKMFGLKSDNLVGMRCCELYHGAKKPRANCTIMRTVTERMPQRVELEDSAKGRILRVITDPIISDSGRIAGVVCTTRDVTDEKLIERRLIQQERISAIGEIAAGIAHEVGTPLNIISANVEFMLRGKTVNPKEELEAIREQTQSITQLVRQLLDFSRDRSPEFSAVNANQLIEKTVGLLNHQLQKARIRTEFNLASYLPTVDGDPSQIQQVLFNLITNARQAMEVIPPRERERILKITTDSGLMPTENFPHPHIIIKIADNGLGIPADALPHVFNPFFTANKEGGTGLGLAISYRIIQKHSGLIRIENNPENGITVIVKLPLLHNLDNH